LNSEVRVDFWSNDYLGLSRYSAFDNTPDALRVTGLGGSAGSRLVSGNHPIFAEFESFLAGFHYGESSLIFNSAYAANLGVLSSVVGRHDTIIFDSLCHASMRDGIRLAGSGSFHFQHNEIEDLMRKLHHARGSVLIAIESLYSMDGDYAPLGDIIRIAQEYGAEVFVDEAHSTGIRGPGGSGYVVEEGVQDQVFARVHGWGKAVGSHGACVVGPEVLRDWLINKARPFIYTTAFPPAHIFILWQHYRQMIKNDEERSLLWARVAYLRKGLRAVAAERVLGDPRSPIMGLLFGSSSSTLAAARYLRSHGFGIGAIRSPTVPAGSERIRLCVHSFNTENEIDELLFHIEKIL
jgi:8-amino-7-oxononanoate synthase